MVSSKLEVVSLPVFEIVSVRFQFFSLLLQPSNLLSHATDSDWSFRYTLESRYERGVDTTATGIVVYPPSNKTGRRLCGGAVEFTVATAPTNVGMILRRTLDYGVPHQVRKTSQSPHLSSRSRMPLQRTSHKS